MIHKIKDYFSRNPFHTVLLSIVLLAMLYGAWSVRDNDAFIGAIIGGLFTLIGGASVAWWQYRQQIKKDIASALKFLFLSEIDIKYMLKQWGDLLITVNQNKCVDVISIKFHMIRMAIENDGIGSHILIGFPFFKDNVNMLSDDLNKAFSYFYSQTYYLFVKLNENTKLLDEQAEFGKKQDDCNEFEKKVLEYQLTALRENKGKIVDLLEYNINICNSIMEIIEKEKVALKNR